MANFFRSVLLRLQSKNVTAGTSASTVSTDTGYDGLSSVTVNPTPSETKTQAPSTSAIDVTPSSGKLLSKVTVSAIQTETKSQAAGTSDIDVTPSSGKYLTKVTITPQQHSGYYPASGSNITSNGTKDLGASHNYRYVNVQVPGTSHTETYTPAANKSNNDMGTTHSYRYVNTSGMIVPSGNKSITANGTGIDVSSYATASVSVPSPTLSGDASASDVLASKTFYSNSYTKQTGSISSKAAATYNTSSSDQTITAGQYLSGAQTIKAVTTSGISAANIKDGAVVKVGDANSATRIANVTGTFTDASTVSSGQTAATASEIKTGYSAWVDGVEVKGSYDEPDDTETILWENPSPLADFAEQTVTLNQAYTSFDEIRFYWRSSGNTERYISTFSAYSKDYVSNTQTGATTGSDTDPGKAKVSLGGCRWSNGAYTRIAARVSDTEIRFALASSTQTTSTYAKYVIPTKIVGVKSPFSSPMKATTLWTNSNPSASSGFAAQTITLSDTMANYDLIEITFTRTTSDTDYVRIMAPFSDISGVNSDTDYPKFFPAMFVRSSSSTNQAMRYAAYVNGTQIRFSACTYVGASGTNNTRIIPHTVKGIKAQINYT